MTASNGMRIGIVNDVRPFFPKKPYIRSFCFSPQCIYECSVRMGCVHKGPSRTTYGVLCASMAVCARVRVCCRDRLPLELVRHITEDDWNSSCSKRYVQVVIAPFVCVHRLSLSLFHATPCAMVGFGTKLCRGAQRCEIL